MAKPQCNIDRDPLRWSLHAAEREGWGDRDTLQRRLAACGQQPDQNGYYTTRQLISTLSGGDLKAERLRLVKAQAVGQELKNKEAQLELLPRREVLQKVADLILLIRAEVLGNSDLSESVKNSLLSHIADFKPPWKP